MLNKCKVINDGFVLAIGTNGDYGNRVYIRHTDGTTLMYAHLESTELELNQEVKKGDVVGIIGDSGYSKGVHLHVSFFEKGTRRLYASNTSDPMPYFKKHGYPCEGKITNKYGSDICNPKLDKHEGVDFSAKTKRTTKKVKND